MKVKQLLVPVAVASVTRSKLALVEQSGRLSRVVEKVTTVPEPIVKIKVPKVPKTIKAVKAKGPAVKIKPIKTDNAELKVGTKSWDLAKICEESLCFPTTMDFESWISTNYATEPALWIKFAKLNTGILSVTYKEALMVALCYGWIDGIRKRVDDTYFVQRFTPRKGKSNWSLVNKNYVAELVAAGKIKESGWKAINDAKADGRWDQNN